MEKVEEKRRRGTGVQVRCLARHSGAKGDWARQCLLVQVQPRAPGGDSSRRPREHWPLWSTHTGDQSKALDSGAVETMPVGSILDPDLFSGLSQVGSLETLRAQHAERWVGFCPPYVQASLWSVRSQVWDTQMDSVSVIQCLSPDSEPSGCTVGGVTTGASEWANRWVKDE